MPQEGDDKPSALMNAEPKQMKLVIVVASGCSP